MGYVVECAENGEKVIEIVNNAGLSDQSFALVILDLTVPGGMGGKDACKLSRIDPSIKAIVSSGYANDPIMANYREFGFSAVLPKPYRVEELIETVRQVLND